MKTYTFSNTFRFHGRIKPAVTRAPTAIPLRASATLTAEELRQAVFEILG